MSAKRKCPFSPARLQELYWREGKSIKQLCVLANSDFYTVRRWISEAGIVLRTKRQAHILLVTQQPKLKPPVNYRHHGNVGPASIKALKEHHAHAVKLASRARRDAARLRAQALREREKMVNGDD
jgi:hypothetical protein